MPTPGDTLFGSLERARASVPGDRRTVSGLRNGDTWVELSYDELLEHVVVASAQLAALGLGEGDVLCVQLPNWTEAVVYTYAASRLGAVVCPVTTIYRQRELGFILRRTQCKVVVVPSVYRGHDYAAMVRSIADTLPDLRHVVCVGATDVPGVVSSSDLLQPSRPRAASPGPRVRWRYRRPRVHLGHDG